MKTAKPPSGREWVIFTEKERHVIAAPSLRTALRNFGESKGRVIAAIEACCLPVRKTDDQPFMAVFLENPHYRPPQEL